MSQIDNNLNRGICITNLIDKTNNIYVDKKLINVYVNKKISSISSRLVPYYK